ncbi:MAG: ABC transporter permease, partial [Nitrospinota bacterium]
MGALPRGLRNVYRSPARATLVVAILALSVGVYITMTQAGATIGEHTGRVASEAQTLLEVRGAGASGMGVGADALPEEFFRRALGVPGAARVEKYLFTRMIDRSRAASISIVVGVEPGATLRVASHGELGSPRTVAGRNFRPEDRGKPVVIMGKAYAEAYGLSVGSDWTLQAKLVQLQDRPNPSVVLQDTQVKVIGIFESGFVFGDNQVFIPLDVAQRIFKQEGKLSHIFVTASSIEEVSGLSDRLFSALEEKADVISGADLAVSWARSLATIRANSLLSAAIAVSAGALVVLFTMLLAARERTREVGILKAVGASDADVAKQFAAEALGLSVLGGVLGLVLFALGGARLASVLLGVASSGLNPATAMGGEDPASSLLLRYELTPTSLGFALLGVAALTVIGGIIPVVRAVRMRPAEAMR